MRRRDFIKFFTLFYGSLLIGNEVNIKKSEIRIKMIGDLDDDLIIIRATPRDWSFECCYQMHNPTNVFTLEGKSSKSIHAPGWIEYEKTLSVDSNETLLIALANEREEREDSKTLLARTHYKSVELSCDDEILIPSMIPEKGDLPDVPTWYHPKSPNAVYNYYRAWENATINIGLIFPEEGDYEVYLLNQNENIVTNQTFRINRNSNNLKFNNTVNGKVGNSPMEEMDGGVFSLSNYSNNPNDLRVKELAIYTILTVNRKGEMTKIPLPYPFPYINRIFVRAA